MLTTVFITMREVAACLLGPYLAHIGAKVYKGDILSNSSPRKNVSGIKVKITMQNVLSVHIKDIWFTSQLLIIFFKQLSNT